MPVEKNSPFLNEPAENKSEYTDDKKPFFSPDRTVARKIREAKSGLASLDEKTGTRLETIPQLFKRACEASGNKPAMRVERPCPPFDKDSANLSAPFEDWKTWNYQEYYDESLQAARGMVTLGLKRYDAVNIFGFNCPEWLMATHACMMAGGITAGIYPSDTPAQVAFKAKHSSGAIAVIQKSKLDLFKNCVTSGEVPNMKAIVVWGVDDSKELGGDVSHGEQKVRVLSWNDLIRGQIPDATDAKTVNGIIESLQPGDVACYIYTSGTTGDPKAVMITHDNIIFEAAVAKSLVPGGFGNGEERIMSYLPLSHVAGCMVDIVMPIVTTANCSGWAVAGFARVYDLSKGTFGKRLVAVKPTIFLGVPRVWEKIAEKIKAIGAAIPPGRKKDFSTAMKRKGAEFAKNIQMGGTGIYPSYYTLASKAVFKTIKAKLGLEHCKFAFTGAAPISFDTLEYFGQLGLHINEVYGMSECTGATTWSTNAAHLWGSCGWAMPGTEVKIFACDEKDFNIKTEVAPVQLVDSKGVKTFPSDLKESQQGEICFRGRHIMAGYMANPDLGQAHVDAIIKKNHDAIDAEGWLHSGDKGCISTTGMIKITGRYKELIIGSGGENIAPVPIEDSIKKLAPCIANIMMVGDKRKFNVALVTLKAVGATGEEPGTDELDGQAKTWVPGIDSIPAARDSKEYTDKIWEAINATNNDGSVCPSNASKIQKFSILPRDFSVATEEFTPTLKLKRSVVDKKHAALIDRMYESKERYFPGDDIKGAGSGTAQTEPAAPEPKPEPTAPEPEPAAPVAEAKAPEPVAEAKAPEPVAEEKAPEPAAPEPVAEAEKATSAPDVAVDIAPEGAPAPADTAVDIAPASEE
jgi:long-chain-fatty-acid--CoA ligase ACSBG